MSHVTNLVCAEACLDSHLGGKTVIDLQNNYKLKKFLWEMTRPITTSGDCLSLYYPQNLSNLSVQTKSVISSASTYSSSCMKTHVFSLHSELILHCKIIVLAQNYYKISISRYLILHCKIITKSRKSLFFRIWIGLVSAFFLMPPNPITPCSIAV